MNKRGQIRESEIKEEIDILKKAREKRIKKKFLIYVFITVFLVILIISVFALFFYFMNYGNDDKNDTIIDNESDIPNPVDNPDLEIPGPNVSRGTSGNRSNPPAGTGGSSGGTGGGDPGDGNPTPPLGCTPDCTNKQCGDDSCAGSCGACNSSSTCIDGGCIPCTRNLTCETNYPFSCAKNNFDGCSYSLDCTNNCNSSQFCYSGLGYYNYYCFDQSQICTDSDNGINLVVNGSVIRQGVTKNDICSSSMNLTEYYCNSVYGYRTEIKNQSFYCEGGCLNGKCIGRIPIDQYFIDNQGGNGDYLLNQDNATYILDTDVTTEKTAFWIVGDNITFDLNGHTIYYDNLDIPEINNKNFETDDFTGWDMSGAPGYYRRTQTKAVNDSVLVLPALYSVIYSPAFTIPKANYSFVTTAYMLGDGVHWSNYSLIKIDFVDANTREVINIDGGTFKNNEGVSMPCGIGYEEIRWSQNQSETDTVYHALRQNNDQELKGVDCEIRTPDTPEVRIRVRTYNATIIDYLDFRGMRHPAIGAIAGYINPYWQYFSSRDVPSSISLLPASSRKAYNVKIINGTIIQGNARSGIGIASNQLKKLTIKDLKLILQDTPNAQGIDAGGSGYFPDAGNHYIDNLTLEVPQTGVFKRDYIKAAIMLSGNATIVNSNIRTDTSGILIYPPNGQHNIQGLNISNNIIELGFKEAPMDTNHAGIWFSGFKNAKVYNNKITGQGYIGIQVGNNLGTEVFNNTVLMWGRSSFWYAENMMGIEVYDCLCIDGNCRSADNIIHNNNVTVIVDPLKKENESRPSIKAMNFRNRYAFNESSCGNNSIYNNVFTAINLEPNLNSKGVGAEAIAVAFSLYPPLLKEQIYNNTIQSNNFLVYAGYHSGYEKGALLADNKFIKLNAGVIPAHHEQHYAFESISMWNGDTYISGGGLFRDNTWINTNPDENGYLVNKHLGAFRIENTFRLKVLSNGNPINGASIVITDNLGNIVYTGMADSNGYVETVLKDYENNYSKQIWYNPYKITVSYSGNTRILTVTAKTPHREYVVDLGNNVNSAPVVDAGENITIVSNSTSWWGVSSDTYLKASVDDDGLPLSPGKVVVNWTVVSIEGSGSIRSFMNSSGSEVSYSNTSYIRIRPTAYGNYTLRITASDGELSSSDVVTIFIRNNYSLSGNPDNYRGLGSFGSVKEDLGEGSSIQGSEVFTLNPFERLINWFRQMFHLEPL